jgi:hypothetical protein
LVESLKREFRHISYCGKYYCAFCDYHKGTIVEAAKNLLVLAERYGSLRLIADANNACDFDEFMKGLGWLASQEQPCKGCRFGGGWSWWGDCPVRGCCIQKGVDFCYQCEEFPCKKLREEPLLKRKKEMIEAANQIKSLGIESYMQRLKKRYMQASTT